MIIEDEARRLQALQRYEILDTPPDGAFDRVTALASRIFSMPIVLVSLVDHDRIWFKSRHGLPDVAEISRDPGLCASAILGDDVYVIEDAKNDPRTLSNPLVVGELGLRFYAAAPLQTTDGHNLGTLCLIDKRNRYLNRDQEAMLRDLAAIVMGEMELRLASRTAAKAADERIATLERQLETRVGAAGEASTYGTP